MRHIDKGDPDLTLDALQLNAHLLSQFKVECAERLIKEKYGWLIHERAGEGDTLCLTARELRRDSLLKADELHELHRLANTALDLVPLDPGATQSERDVLIDGEVRE
jgi:hypothetical protein